MKTLTLILHNIRSVYNVGAILRSADGLGVAQVYFTGYTPHPAKGLAHEREKLQKQLHKTALGAEKTVLQHAHPDITQLIATLRQSGYSILALEQAPNSLKFGTTAIKELISVTSSAFNKNSHFALILGEETQGIPPDILQLADHILEIPMHGQKESLNVSIAAAIAIWEILK